MRQHKKKLRHLKNIFFFFSIALLFLMLTPSFSTNYQEALTAVQQNDLDKAQSILNQALNRNPNDINSKTLFAIVTYRQGNYEAAETQLLELSTVEHLSNNDSILYMLADAQNTLGFKEEALETIITAYEVNPENQSIQQLYTSIYYDISDHYAAETATQPQTQPQENVLISSRAMDTQVIGSQAAASSDVKLQAIQNALFAATQGTTLVPNKQETIEIVQTSEETNTVETDITEASVGEANVVEATTPSEKPYTFEEASQSFADNNFNLARAQLENVLAGNPNHPEATKMLAELAYKDGSLNQSLELYTRLTQSHQFIQNPQADVHYGLALTKRSLGDIEGAFHHTAEALLQTPDDEAIIKLYNNLTTELGQNGASQLVSESYTFEDALAAYKDNDIELARLRLQQLIAAEPNHKEAITMLAYIIYRDGNSEQAEAMFQSLINQADFDENSDILYGLALAQRNNGKLNDALANTQRAHVSAPDREDVQKLQQAITTAIQTEREKALINAAQNNNETVKLSFSFEDALEAYKANDIETAQAQLETLVAANPDDTDSAILLAYIVYRSDSHRAVEMFTAISEREDFNENSDVLYGLALSHRNSGNLEAAFTHIERAYVAAPEREDVADLYTKLANAVAEAKSSEATVESTPEDINTEDTIQDEEQVQEASPYSFATALEAYKANDIETAKYHFEGLVTTNPDDTDSATLLAYIVYRSDAVAAATMFQNIVDRPDFNDNSDVLYGLALAQRNAGNLDAAYAAIERAYKAAPEREDVTDLYAKLYNALNPENEGS